jgi:hypothetical protein
MVEVMRLDDDGGDCSARDAVEDDDEELSEQRVGGRVARTPSTAVEESEVEDGVSPQP